MNKYESVIDSIFLSNNGEIDLLTGAISPDRFDQIVKRDLAIALLIPVVFLILPVSISFAIWPSIYGLNQAGF